MKALLSVAFAFVAGPAVALSCVAPDVTTRFNTLNDAPETYVVIHGTLTFDETKLPKADLKDQDAIPAETFIPARLTGLSLTEQGFTAAFDRNITFNARCFGPWCVHVASGADVMAFVEHRDGPYVFSLGPCYANGFFAPNAATLNAATACMQGRDCVSRR